VRAVDEEKRTVELSFSSEQPYRRWFGDEILSHDEGAVNLSRLQEIGILLFNHNRDYVLGKVLEVSIVDERGIAKVQFDEDDEAEKIFQKVKNETLKGVSVGYIVDIWEEVISGSKSSNGKFDGPCSIATKWTPFEISIVSIPADDSVGVGRDLDDDDIDQKQIALIRVRNHNKILLNLGGIK
jgi:HK97 family phage prohead protease